MISQKVIENTLVDWPRLYTLESMLLSRLQVPGVLAEVGVYKGGTALLIAQTCRSKHLYLFDTFAGLPEVDPTKDQHVTGAFNDTSVEHVTALLANCNVSIHKGVFPKENSEVVKDEKFSFVHLDVDIYQSVSDCLKFFHPRMSQGGVIIIDDYGDAACKGAELATDQFCAKHNLKIHPTAQCQVAILY